MEIKEACELLERAILEPSRLGEIIAQFQHSVWNGAEISGAADEILCELAYDLDYFEPDIRARAEDPSFFGEERAIAEIQKALERLRAVEAGLS